MALSFANFIYPSALAAVVKCILIKDYIDYLFFYLQLEDSEQILQFFLKKKRHAKTDGQCELRIPILYLHDFRV